MRMEVISVAEPVSVTWVRFAAPEHLDGVPTDDTSVAADRETERL
jgi:hypothetical protein